MRSVSVVGRPRLGDGVLLRILEAPVVPISWLARVSNDLLLLLLVVVLVEACASLQRRCSVRSGARLLASSHAARGMVALPFPGGCGAQWECWMRAGQENLGFEIR